MCDILYLREDGIDRRCRYWRDRSAVEIRVMFQGGKQGSDLFVHAKNYFDKNRRESYRLSMMRGKRHHPFTSSKP